MKGYKDHFLSILIIGSIIALAAGVYGQNRRASASRTNTSQSALKFKAIVFSHDRTAEGGSSSHTFEVSDGAKIIRTGELYASVARANERLQNKLKDAIKINERKPVFEKKRIVGERVIAIFDAEHPDNRTVMILGTYNEVYWSIEAPTLRHALAFVRFYERD